MKKIQLYEDTMIYQFDELIPYITNVVVIERDEFVFVIDTFLGSDYMQEIRNDYKDKIFKVILSHKDFDHVFGTPAFIGYEIIAHVKCYEWLKQFGEKQLQDEHQWLKGKCEAEDKETAQ